MGWFVGLVVLVGWLFWLVGVYSVDFVGWVWNCGGFVGCDWFISFVILDVTGLLFWVG